MKIDFGRVRAMRALVVEALRDLDLVSSESKRLKSHLEELSEREKAHEVLDRLAGLDIERLRDSASVSLRIESARKAGFKSVRDVYVASNYALAAVNGISDSQALEMKQIATKMYQAVASTLAPNIRIDT